MINIDKLEFSVFQELESIYDRFLQLPIVSEILERLEKELPEKLFYHSVDHSKDVLFESLKFGLLGGLGSRELELLAIAAAYHDSGYLVRMEDNEVLGAEFAIKAMKEAGTYTPEEITIVSDMIIDTKLNDLGSIFVRTISSGLAEYLLDADLSNLGRDDFFKKGKLLQKELDLSDEVFHSLTLKLIDNHQWQTESARKLRSTQCQLNFEKFRTARS